MHRHSTTKSILISVLLATLILLFSNSLFGQQLTGSLSGTARDSSGAAIPSASVELKNASSGDVRRAVTNGDGFFAIVSVPPGTYNLKVASAGFTPWQADGIILTQGDSRTVPNIVLKVGGVKVEVEVIAEGASVAPVDTGAVSTTLNQTMVDEFTLSGRDAGELMKIMPGMGTNSGLSGNTSFNGADHVTGSNAGPAGSFSANGTLPNGGMAYMLDGANLLDNNMGTQIANINPEMVSEVKMLMSAYGAEFAKGPVVFQAFSKSGGKGFHGEGYLFARNSIFNSEDSFQKNQGNKNVDSHYYYPGGNIGGPVIIPGLHFNRNRDKLFFWFGYEYMAQSPAGSLIQYFVPTAQMKAGNFSPEYLNTLIKPNGWGNAMNVPCANAANGGCPAIAAQMPDGMIPASMDDPNGLAYMKLFPAPNADPTKTGGYNYQFNNTLPQNRWEQSEKIDYAVNDNTKLSVTYTYQKEFDHHPIDTWWAPNQALPYPTPMDAHTPSKVLAVNFTKVFSATLVNEFVGSYASYLNTLTPANPALIDPTKLGFTYKGLFGSTSKQFADFLSWSSGVPDFMPQASFGGTAFAGNFGAHKYDPAFSDNVSKVWGTHTLKFGFYWANFGNKQGTTGYQGQFETETYGGTTTNNTVADLLIGHAQSYTQTSTIAEPAFESRQVSLYAQDSWKVSRRLTLNYGLRFDHVGQWSNPQGNGVIVWDPSKYSNAANAPNNTGIVWHSIDSSIPLSGWVSPTFYYEPRFGAAYDLFGNAKTVLRGGASKFYFTQGAIDDSDPSSSGQFTWGTPIALTSFAQINSLTGVPSAGSPLNHTTITPDDLNDSKMPYSWTFNFTVSQALPFRSVAEFSYVGSRTRDMVIGSSNDKINDANIIPMGAFFTSDPVSGGAPPCTRGVTCNNLNTNDYMAHLNYQDIYVMGHGSYSNYNSFQATWTRSVKPVVIVANYVFGKVLGTYDGVSANGADNSGTVDGFSLAKNYGPEAYDHTHIFNLSYSLDLPKPTHNRAFGAVVNGWTLSGWTGVQSGTPLEANAASFNVQWPSGVSNSSYLGTNAVTLMPQLLCNPTKGLSSGQYFNPACFGPPAAGYQGTEIWPYIHGPAVIHSDMSLFKSFQFGENKKLQFRLQAYNFLNHPNAAFTVQNNGDLQLNFGTPQGTLSQTNTNAETNGKPAFTVGQRLIELAVKFYF
jgi:hypothetical protein